MLGSAAEARELVSSDLLSMMKVGLVKVCASSSAVEARVLRTVDWWSALLMMGGAPTDACMDG